MSTFYLAEAKFYFPNGIGNREKNASEYEHNNGKSQIQIVIVNIILEKKEITRNDISPRQTQINIFTKPIFNFHVNILIQKFYFDFGKLFLTLFQYPSLARALLFQFGPELWSLASVSRSPCL